jgi:hypothetical protein
MDTIKHSRQEVEEFLDGLILSYNSLPVPGILGAIKYLNESGNNGKKDLADRTRPILDEINSKRPFELGSLEKERILSELGY